MRLFFAWITALTLMASLSGTPAAAQDTPADRSPAEPSPVVVPGAETAPGREGPGSAEGLPRPGDAAPGPQPGEGTPEPAGDPAESPQVDGQPAPANDPARESGGEPTAGEPALPPANVPENEDAGAGADPEPLPAIPSATPLPQASGEEADMQVPSPGEMSDRLAVGLSETYDGEDTWTAPTPVFTVHGYLRMRGELMDTFWLGRYPHETMADIAALRPLRSGVPASAEGLDPESLGPDPFTRFRAFERRPDPDGADRTLACVDEQSLPEGGGLCEVDAIQFANLRLRLSPELNVTEDVRVRATLDILDNVMAGTAPVSYYGSSPLLAQTFADSDLPTGGGGGSSIVARRAWAEVRNRDLGELRFGRMPQHWGLGMVFNNGDGLDQDFSTDLDRVLAITKLEGFYLSASYDFIAEGPIGASQTFRPDFDGSQLDDVDQFSFRVARITSQEDQEAALERGELVLNGGLHFTLRHQDAILIESEGEAPTLRSVASTRYTPDLWGQLLLPGLRIELELAWHLGRLRSDGQDLDITSFGGALETEFRFLEDKLGLYLNTGLATGDQDVEGLSAGAGFVRQLTRDTTVSTFAFHPSYQIDMILWRNIMRQVTGAYYLKPGISYDFVRTAFGELFGAQLDVIYSRASSMLQTPGNSENLGLELNAQVYWRSEDGADPEDGFHAAIQYGVLFPMAGLGFPDYEGLDQSLDTAQQLRLILGVVF